MDKFKKRWRDLFTDRVGGWKMWIEKTMEILGDFKITAAVSELGTTERKIRGGANKIKGEEKRRT